MFCGVLSEVWAEAGRGGLFFWLADIGGATVIGNNNLVGVAVMVF